MACYAKMTSHRKLNLVCYSIRWKNEGQSSDFDRTQNG